jgi:hypothetical protein
MRLVAILVTGLLAIAVIAEGAYIARTRGQLQQLERRLEALSEERDSAFGRAEPIRRGGRERDLADLDDDDRPVAPGPPPPRFTRPPSGNEAAAPGDPRNPLPLPAALDSAEAREQLRQFVMAQLERERQEARDRMTERRSERETRWREQVAKQLALSPPETEKFNQILNNSQARRDALQARIQAGELEGPAIRSAIMGLREESSRELRSLLGDERATKYEELRRSEGGRGGPGGGGGGGLGRFGAGPPGGGPPGGPPIP